MIKAVVVGRIQQLCEEKHLAVNALANMSGMTPSTLYSLLNDARKDIRISTIKKICDGLNITILEFFDCELFEGLEQEVV